MKKVIVSIMTMGIMLFTSVSTSFPVCAESSQRKTEINGIYYEFNDKNSKYEITSKTQSVSKDNKEHNSLGTISINGTVTNTFEKNGFTAYEIEELPEEEQESKAPFTIKFSYDDTLKNAGKNKWHLYEDKKKEVNSIALDDSIGYGAIILQTSCNGKRWVTNYTKTNITSDVSLGKSCINDLQLTNGCYYRIIVAYETQIKVDPNNIQFLNIDTPLEIPDYEYLKCADVYEFYAGYKIAESKDIDNKNYKEIGKTKAVKVDNGFSEELNMDSDDPHLGWNIGKFVVDGWTSTREKNSVITFLKNNDDRVTLWFKMDEGITDINKLNNNEHLSINNDTNGYDTAMNIPVQNFGHGTLIIRFTDYRGKEHAPKIYTNFLEAVAYPGANTKVELFEEGDYEVTLDYELRNDKGLDHLYDYKMAFDFKIRNGNTKVYPTDLTTGSYLANGSATENGFYIDWAKSRYLEVNYQRSIWTKDVNGNYIEDPQSDEPAKESDKYEKPGIYTIDVKNPTTGNHADPIRIYVGIDTTLIDTMRAITNDNNAEYTIDEIVNYIDNEGYTVAANGELIEPQPEIELTEDSSQEDALSVADTVSDDNSSSTSSIAEESSNSDNRTFIYIGIGTVAVLLLIIINRKSKRKQSSK